MSSEWSKSITFAIIICLLVVSSCKKASTSESNEYLTIQISKSSGDDFSYGNDEEPSYYAPYPFNLGFIEVNNADQEVMVISQKVDSGKKMDIMPIAKMSIEEMNGTSKDVFIAVPIDDNLAIVRQMNFSEFTVEQFSLKQIVEYWYSNRYGLQGTAIKGWAPADLDDFK